MGPYRTKIGLITIIIWIRLTYCTFKCGPHVFQMVLLFFSFIAKKFAYNLPNPPPLSLSLYHAAYTTNRIMARTPKLEKKIRAPDGGYGNAHFAFNSSHIVFSSACVYVRG